MLSTPVLLIIFNRPDLTGQVFEAIRQARPAQLFIAADGPRNESEKALTNASRQMTEFIDWPCDVKRNYQNINQGCAKGVSGAINWFYSEVEEGIILEDDCLPIQDFFCFCQKLLIRYRNDNRVMCISGDGFLPFKISTDYYFTNYTHIWGWATWRRAWLHYDLSMKEWGAINQNQLLKKVLKNKYAIDYWHACFDSVYKNGFNNWDYQWTFAVWNNKGLAIAPATNLISNIGFGKYATHTLNAESALANKTVMPMLLKNHPDKIEVNEIADAWVRDNIYGKPPMGGIERFLRKLKLFKS